MSPRSPAQTPQEIRSLSLTPLGRQHHTAAVCYPCLCPLVCLCVYLGKGSEFFFFLLVENLSYAIKQSHLILFERYYFCQGVIPAGAAITDFRSTACVVKLTLREKERQSRADENKHLKKASPVKASDQRCCDNSGFGAQSREGGFFATSLHFCLGGR